MDQGTAIAIPAIIGIPRNRTNVIATVTVHSGDLGITGILPKPFAAMLAGEIASGMGCNESGDGQSRI